MHCFTFVLIAIMAALGHFARDIYLPMLPRMQTDFHTTSQIINISVQANWLAAAIGSLFLGVLADMSGRRVASIAAMSLFMATNAACLLTTNVTFFNAARTVQGLAEGCLVVAMAIARDLIDDPAKLTVTQAHLNSITGVSVMIAPPFGALLALTTNTWRADFAFLLIVGMVCLYGFMCHFTESFKPKSAPGSGKVSVSRLSVLCNLRNFGCMVSKGLLMGVVLSNLSNVPLLLTEFFEWTTYQVGVARRHVAPLPSIAAVLRSSDPTCLTHSPV